MKYLICFFALAIPVQAKAGLLYNQGLVFNGQTNTLTSSYINSSTYFDTLDNFKVTSNSVLTSITWSGDYLSYNSSTGVYSNATPDTTQWQFAIYTPGGTSAFPFTLVASQTVAASGVTEALGGTFQFGNSTINYYNESVDLSGINLLGGQTYYLSIFSNNSTSNDFFSWLSSGSFVGDDTSSQFSSASNTTSTISQDRTFALFGNPSVVPEPSSLVMTLMGILALILGGVKRGHCYFRWLNAQTG